MSHELEKLADGYSMAWTGEVPWHGLGYQVDPDLTPVEMLKAAKLDWGVVPVPMYVNYNGKEVAVGRKALIRDRDSKVLTVISDDWEPVQNLEAFEFFNDFVQAGDMQMHTAGSLAGGTMVWALAKVSEGFTLFNGDRVESYLLFSNPHLYGKCVDIRFTPIRVVCNNTLQLSLAGKKDLMVRKNHRAKFDADLVKSTLGIAKKKLGDYKEMAKFLGSKKFQDDDVLSYFKTVFPVTSAKKDTTKELSRPAKTAIGVLYKQPGAEFAPGTWWQAYNASTFTIDHLLGHSDDTRLNSAWYGVNRQKKLLSLEKAIEYAEAA